jgi:CRP/FNR family cyclic AMP-dependent transcriptional regulator
METRSPVLPAPARPACTCGAGTGGFAIIGKANEAGVAQAEVADGPGKTAPTDLIISHTLPEGKWFVILGNRAIIINRGWRPGGLFLLCGLRKVRTMKERDMRQFLKRFDLFNGLNGVQLRRIAGLCREASYQAGETILQQDSVTGEVYLIKEGSVEVIFPQSVPGADSRAVSPLILGQGQMFGEIALLDRGPRSATVRCATDGTQLYLFDREDFLRLCEEDTSIGYIVMRNIAADLCFKIRHGNLAWYA